MHHDIILDSNLLIVLLLKVLLFIVDSFHFHSEYESAPMAQTFRFDFYRATALLNDLIYDGQTKPYPFTVHLSRSV